MSSRLVKLGEVLRHRKGSIVIDDSVEYKRCRVQLHRRGVEVRDRVPGTVIRTKKQQLCKAGDFIVAEMDAKFGGYGFLGAELEGAIVSSHYYLFEVIKEKMLPEYLAVINKTDILQVQIIAKGSTNYSAVRPADVLAWTIPLPSLEEQRRIIAEVEATEKDQQLLLPVLDQQLTHLTQLRQALLREAMQGQLLPQDPTDEPAAVLLKKLQAAKAATGKGGKRKAGALFPEEAEAVEGPFEIPASWVWCKLGDLAFSSEGGSSFKCEDRAAKGKEWGILKMSAISSGRFEEQENKFYSKEDPKDIGAKIRAGDFIITRASGSAELVAKSVFVQEVIGNVLLNDKTIRYDFGSMSNVEFLNYCNNSTYARAYFRSVNSATSTTMKNVTRPQINGLPIPLPPLAEQHRIVAKLKQLIQHCDALEQRIRESRRLAEQLLQTALREALAPPAGTVSAAAEEPVLLEVATAPEAPRRGRGRPPKRKFESGDQLDFGDIIFD